MTQDGSSSSVFGPGSPGPRPGAPGTGPRGNRGGPDPCWATAPPCWGSPRRPGGQRGDGCDSDRGPGRSGGL